MPKALWDKNKKPTPKKLNQKAPPQKKHQNQANKQKKKKTSKNTIKFMLV